MKFFQIIKDHITMVLMDSQNRKIGLRGGLEKTLWYVRLDLWWVGFRIS